MSPLPSPQYMNFYEQTCLAQLDADDQALRSWVFSWRLMEMSLSSIQLFACAQQIRQWVSNMSRLDSIAQELMKQGRPDFHQKLNRIIQYGEEQIPQFNQMAQSRWASERAGIRPVSPAQPPTLTPQSVFEEGLKGWTSINTHSCYYCGTYLGDLYFDVAICPNCRRKPRPK